MDKLSMTSADFQKEKETESRDREETVNTYKILTVMDIRTK